MVIRSMCTRYFIVIIPLLASKLKPSSSIWVIATGNPVFKAGNAANLYGWGQIQVWLDFENWILLYDVGCVRMLATCASLNSVIVWLVMLIFCTNLTKM